jgi:hypothetical protein
VAAVTVIVIETCESDTLFLSVTLTIVSPCPVRVVVKIHELFVSEKGPVYLVLLKYLAHSMRLVPVVNWA